MLPWLQSHHLQRDQGEDVLVLLREEEKEEERWKAPQEEDGKSLLLPGTTQI